MTNRNIFFFFIALILGQTDFVYSQNTIKHFIFFSRDREAIKNPKFFLNDGIYGAQITYPWKVLEPNKNVYDFTQIEADLKFLSSKRKKLFVQIQDVTFDSTFYAVPKYILTDTIYHGGVNSQYDITSDGKSFKAGWVARRWDSTVAKRYRQLLIKLAEQFDGRIEGINLPETAVDFPENLRPDGFTTKSYIEAIKNNMVVLRSNFKKSVPLQYANFMPGDSKESLETIYDYAKEIKLGVGGPDIKVFKKFQMENSYPLIRNIAGIVPTGMAVQDGNYDVINPKTGKKVTIQEILDFAQNYLKLNYVFWCTEEPYYSKQVLPLLKSLKK
jgi:hypothetical protein